MMHFCILAVWAYNLPKRDLFIAVKLVTMITHSNDLEIEICQLYCYAISLLIKGYSANDAFNMIKIEAK